MSADTTPKPAGLALTPGGRVDRLLVAAPGRMEPHEQHWLLVDAFSAGGERPTLDEQTSLTTFVDRDGDPTHVLVLAGLIRRVTTSVPEHRGAGT